MDGRSGKWCADRSPTAGERSAYAGRLFPRKAAFRPHLTLGRQVILEPGFRAKDYGQTLPPARMLVKEIALMESRRVNGLLQYVPRFVQPIG